mgnify:CR=1 FL=1
MYETILVPTDGSDHARRAAKYAALFARRTNATVHVLSVVDTRTAGGPFNAGGLGKAELERLDADATAQIERTIDSISFTEPPESAVRRGLPREEIVEYANTHHVDLVCMGTQGRTGVDRYVAGSVTEGVVRRASAPVLTVRATDRTTAPSAIDEILLPTDGSDSAEVAIRHGLGIAQAFDARVHVITVVNVGAVGANPEYAPPSSFLRELESQGEAAIDRIVERAEAADVETVTNVLTGNPGMEILEYADEADVDVITMGTAGRTGMNRFLLGSTAERLIRHAPVPVVAVNARDRQSGTD